MTGIYRRYGKGLLRVEWGAYDQLQITRIDGYRKCVSQEDFAQRWMPYLHRLGDLYETDYR